jgi:hypothetical protein
MTLEDEKVRDCIALTSPIEDETFPISHEYAHTPPWAIMHIRARMSCSSFKGKSNEYPPTTRPSAGSPQRDDEPSDRRSRCGRKDPCGSPISGYCHRARRRSGGQDNLSEPTKILIRQAAALSVQLENLQSKIVAGEDVNTEQLVRLSNVQARTLHRLGLKKPAPPRGPTLMEVLSQPRLAPR